MPNKGIESYIFQIPFPGSASELPGKEIVGSKAHNLMRMGLRGLPVPPGFVISAEFCRNYLAHGKQALCGLDTALARELDRLGSLTGHHFGDARRPLLVSVRSGAAVSMPGMMETVLNVGLNDAAVSGLVRMTGNPRLAQDCRRRLVQQFGEVVHGICPSRFGGKVASALAMAGAAQLDELGTSELRELSEAFEAVFESEVGQAFPDEPAAQIRSAIEAVFRSWSSERAKSYRQLNGIPESLGTAVTVQAMVFGNLGPNSGAGVGFTRNPANGRNEVYVDFLANAQGEDVVAGRHRAAGLDDLERRAPRAHQALVAAKAVLEREFRDMQDFEFTVEEGRLLLLQARAGKRTPLAALQIARDLVAEKIISPAEALATLAALDLDEVEETRLQLVAGTVPLATGTSASIGVAVGAVAFDPERVAYLKRSKGPVILVRQTAETADVAALAEAAGLVTIEGARTSHAAVVARQLGKPCIVACGGLAIDGSGRHGTFGSERVAEGDVISIDAAAGLIFNGRLDILRSKPTELLQEIRSWQSAAPAHRGQDRKRSR
jgi:pyruvate,orthophosphate dikinase